MPENSPAETKPFLEQQTPNNAVEQVMEPHADLKLVTHAEKDDSDWWEYLRKPLPLETEAEALDRQSTLQFLAMEAAETLLWSTIYRDTMERYNITEQEVINQLQYNAAEKTKRAPAKIAWAPPAVPDDVVIYCWPYHAESPTGGYSWSSNAKFDPIVSVVTLFGAIWLIGTMMLIGERYFGSCWYLIKAIPLILLPLLGALKGLTHLRVSHSGLVFQSVSGKSTLKSKVLPWAQIRRAYVVVPDGKSALSGKLVFELKPNPRPSNLMMTDVNDIFAVKAGRRRHLALKKIASGAQWRNMVQAMAKYIDVSELDPALLDGVNQTSSRDPSYTKLWLDALTAPPRRQRLQPLSAGTELQSGQYKIETLLGSGGQGSAYLASTGTTKVVLKEYILPVYVDVKVRRQALEDFEHESRMLASLDHTGIVKNLGSFVEDHRAYLVLEYVQGKSLRQLVQEKGALPENDCVKYGIEMCDILSYLHGQSPPVVHQDFTPDNLLVSPEGSLKLIDFMVAKQSASESASSAIVGKHHYMPPEQFRGKATTKSDIYALGCSMFFILTGCEPEPMSTSHPTLQNNDVSGEMNSIVEKATMLDQFERYDKSTAVRRDLEAVLANTA